GALVGGLRQENVAILVVVDGQSDDLFEVAPELDRLEREADVDLGRILAPNTASRPAGAAGAKGVALEQDHASTAAALSEVVGDARADDPAADDDDIRGFSHGALPDRPASWRPGPDRTAAGVWRHRPSGPG